MRALVYHGAGQKSWDEIPDPQLRDDFDAIVGIDAVTICGTDLHILKGDVPEVEPVEFSGTRPSEQSRPWDPRCATYRREIGSSSPASVAAALAPSAVRGVMGNALAAAAGCSAI